MIKKVGYDIAYCLNNHKFHGWAESHNQGYVNAYSEDDARYEFYTYFDDNIIKDLNILSIVKNGDN